MWAVTSIGRVDSGRTRADGLDQVKVLDPDVFRRASQLLTPVRFTYLVRTHRGGVAVEAADEITFLLPLLFIYRSLGVAGGAVVAKEAGGVMAVEMVFEFGGCHAGGVNKMGITSTLNEGRRICYLVKSSIRYSG